MTEPDTPLGTSAGQSKTAPGQDQDRITTDILMERRVDLDLKCIISKGKHLNPKDCAKLKGINSLSYVTRFTRAQLRHSGLELGTPPPRLGPTEVIKVVKEAVSRLTSSTNETATSADAPNVEIKQQAEVLKRLIGDTIDTASRTPHERRLKALAYYAKHANFRNRAANWENFIRRICPEELFPPLIAALADWENELAERINADDSGLAWAKEKVASMWEHNFWWPIQVLSQLSRACIRIRNYHAIQSHDLGEAARVEGFASLIEVGYLWRLLHVNDAKTHESSSPASLAGDVINQFFDDFSQTFSFSAPDQAWLDNAVDPSNPVWPPNVESDNFGRLVLARFTVLFDACDCPQTLYGLYEQVSGSPYVPPPEGAIAHQPYPEEVFGQIHLEDLDICREFWLHLLRSREGSQPSVLTKLCPIHMLFCWHQVLRTMLHDDWWNTATVLASMTPNPVIQSYS